MSTGQEKYFPASYDTTTKVLSLVVFAILGTVFIATKTIFFAIPGALLIALSYAFSPRGYALDRQGLLVKRIIGTVLVRFDDIRAVRRATEDDRKGCIRLFGSGGLFGYYGLFRTTKLGVCQWYVTNRDNVVVVMRTSAKPICISPDDVDGFLATIRASAVLLAGSPEVPLDPRAFGGGRGSANGSASS